VEDPTPRRTDRHRSGEDRPRRGALVALLVVFLVLVGSAAAAGSYYTWCKGAGSEHSPVSLTIPDGASGGDVVARLADRGVIRCGGFVGGLLLQGTAKAGEIRAGDHDLRTDMAFDDAIDILTRPLDPVPTVEVTIPEGYRLTQIAERAQQDLGISSEEFLRLADSGDYALPPYLPAGKRSVEGFLFPKTYEFVKADVDPGALIERMLEQFDTEASALAWENKDRLGVSAYEAVVIASMIEREAVVPGDRAKIAGVIYNRLEIGMTLGIDATLLYDDPTPDGELSASDLEHESPYNTRIHAGLPPTPIASPGLPSLQAALEPADVPYLYYVLCGADGHHRFSVEYGTFLQDKAECLG
jgi:peptidoglycan lytic transglycosylase G